MANAGPSDPTNDDNSDTNDSDTNAGDSSGTSDRNTSDSDTNDSDAFVFPDIPYAHEDSSDAMCIAGLERNSRDLRIAEAACPDFMADVDHHLAGLAPRLGISRSAALHYCDVGVSLERLPDLAELLEGRPFLPLSHLRIIAQATLCLADEHLAALSDELLRYLAPKKNGQALIGAVTLHKHLAHVVETLQPEVRPRDLPDSDEPAPPEEETRFHVDERSSSHTSIKATFRSDLGREFLDCLDAVARAHDCSRMEAMTLLVRSTTTVQVVFNVYRAAEGGRAWMSGPGWLSEVATEEWTRRATHLRWASNGETGGYVATDAMAAFIEGRDGVCRFPGCDQPAHRGDHDHVQNFDKDDPAAGGPSSTANMHCLCRRHHNLKTSKLWDVEAHPDGHEVWSSRDGKHEFVTVPQGPLAGFGRQTFDARVTRKTATLQEFNEARVAAEEEERRITEEALAKSRAAREAEMEVAIAMYDELYGPDATHPDAKLTMKEKREKYPDVPPF